MHSDLGDIRDPLCDLWQAALDAEYGICVETNDRGLLRQQLYRARAEANNPDFEKIEMVLPQKEDELWLVRKDADTRGASNKGNSKPIH